MSPHISRIRRRSFIGLGVAGLTSLSGWRPAYAAARGAKAKQVLVIFEQGGFSHMDTWDPKPEMAVEHASPHKPIQTKIPGVFITELLEKTAAHLEKLAIVRCMTQPAPGIGNSHPKGSQYIFSGEA